MYLKLTVPCGSRRSAGWASNGWTAEIGLRVSWRHTRMLLQSSSPTHSAPEHTHTHTGFTCSVQGHIVNGGSGEQVLHRASPGWGWQWSHPQWWHHNGCRPAAVQMESVSSPAEKYCICQQQSLYVSIHSL